MKTRAIEIREAMMANSKAVTQPVRDAQAKACKAQELAEAERREWKKLPGEDQLTNRCLVVGGSGSGGSPGRKGPKRRRGRRG